MTKDEEKKLPETRYYWTAASHYKMGGFVKEVRATSGQIITPEQPLEISDHTLITSDSKVIKFVEGHYGFKLREVIPVKDLDEANLMTRRLEGAKRERKFRAEVEQKPTPGQCTTELTQVVST